MKPSIMLIAVACGAANVTASGAEEEIRRSGERTLPGIVAFAAPEEGTTISDAEHAPATERRTPARSAGSDAGAPGTNNAPTAHQVRRTFERITRQLARHTNEPIRSKAHRELREWTDPRHFPVMIDVLSRGDREAHQALLVHLADQGDTGQEALLGIALASDHPFLRTGAGDHLRAPAPHAVRMLLARALRSGSDEVIRRAARHAADLHVPELLPLLVRVQFIAPIIRHRIDSPWEDGFVHSITIGSVSTRPTRSPVRLSLTGGGLIRFRGLRGHDDITAVPRIRFGYEIDPLPRTPAPLRRDEVRDAILKIASEALGRPVIDPGANPDLWRDWYREQYRPELDAIRTGRSRQSEMHRRIDEAYAAYEPWNTP